MVFHTLGQRYVQVATESAILLVDYCSYSLLIPTLLSLVSLLYILMPYLVLAYTY